MKITSAADAKDVMKLVASPLCCKRLSASLWKFSALFSVFFGSDKYSSFRGQEKTLI